MQVTTLPESVALVIVRSSYNVDKIKSAYIAFDTKEAKAFVEKYTYDECRYDEKTHEQTRIKVVPNVVETSNSGFELSVDEESAPDTWDNKGKRLFIGCRIKKDNINVRVNIYTEALINLMLHTNFINGKCQSRLGFMKSHGKLGMIPDDKVSESTNSRNNAKKKQEHLNKVKSGDGSNWEPGVFYETLEKANALIGEVTRAFKISKTSIVLPGTDKDYPATIFNIKPNFKRTYATIGGHARDKNVPKIEKLSNIFKNDNYWLEFYYNLSKREKTNSIINFDMAPKDFIARRRVAGILGAIKKYEACEPSKRVHMDYGFLEVTDAHNPYCLDYILRYGIVTAEEFKLTPDEKKLIMYVYETDSRIHEIIAQYTSVGRRIITYNTSVLDEESRAFLKSILDKC